LRTAKRITLAQIDTVVFEFASVLRRLQEAKDLPLLDELLSSTLTCSPPQLPFQLFDLIHKIKESEILRSHILATLGSRTKQLILIGNKRQLRPKVNNCRHSVEKGEGCDLNRSIFERLVWEDFPHQILNEQQCMRPELSSLIRQLTYPALVDASKTLDRPDLRGFQDNVIFVNHTYPEQDIPKLADRKDTNSSSKQNTFEADMVLKCVHYLGQQGYRQENFMVLDPYLAQLHLLRDLLSRENEPILNDHDFYDLGRAGLVPAVSPQLSRRPIRIATIGKSHSSHYFISRSLHVFSTLHKS
jgi:hypothetical protein